MWDEPHAITETISTGSISLDVSMWKSSWETVIKQTKGVQAWQCQSQLQVLFVILWFVPVIIYVMLLQWLRNFAAFPHSTNPYDPILPTHDPILPTHDPILPTQDLILPTHDPILPTHDLRECGFDNVRADYRFSLWNCDCRNYRYLFMWCYYSGLEILQHFPIIPIYDPILPIYDPILQSMIPSSQSMIPSSQNYDSILPIYDPILPKHDPILPIYDPILPTHDPIFFNPWSHL